MTEVAIVRRLLSVAWRPDSNAEPEVAELSSDSAPLREAPSWRAGKGLRLLSLAPIGGLALALLAGPGRFGGIFTAPPDMVGVPLGVVFETLFLALGTLGTALVWRTRSRGVAFAALALCTWPATFGTLMTPGLIVILQNLAV